MKVTRIFGVVLFLHIGVIAALVVQPGCSTTQPPTANPEAGSTGDFAPDDGSEIVPEGGMETLDPAFNSGVAGSDRFDPTRPAGDYSTPLGGDDPLVPAAGTGVTLDEPGYTVHTVKRGDTLWGISNEYGVPVSELYEVNGLDKNSVLRIGQQVRVPGGQAVGAIDTPSADTYQPSEYEGGTVAYTVKRGDTLSKIASQYDTSVRAIKAANGLSSDMIRVGQELMVPSNGGSSAGSGPSTTGPAPSTVTVTSDTAATSGGGTPPMVSSPSETTHVVQPGEFPGTIAARYGMTTEELLAINGIRNPRTLQVGQTLVVRPGGSGGSAAPRPAPATTQGASPIEVIAADPDTGPAPVTIETGGEDEVSFDDPDVPVVPVVVEDPE